MYVKFSNNVEAKQIGSYLDVEGIKSLGGNELIVALRKECYHGVGRRSEAKNEFEIDVRRFDLEMESGSYWLDKVRTSIWRDVRTLAIEEAYMTKYSIHPGEDTMLCGFRLTNRWLRLLLQPELPSRSGKGYLGFVVKVISVSSGYNAIWV
ncbi:hypothetical protein Tco_0925303 [Tanacetum coccineum]|uniref:Uncharacterized protein n=1 Tax=Tanacetum coccineum TaxID=301880 RepID=A0ABQ5DDG3_9ASTR